MLLEKSGASAKDAANIGYRAIVFYLLFSF
jgi:hypothetical protein